MTTEATAKKIVVKKSPKLDVAPKATKAPAAKKVEAQKTSAVTGKVKVTQMIGSIGRRHDQEATLVGLGLNKLRVFVVNTPNNTESNPERYVELMSTR